MMQQPISRKFNPFNFYLGLSGRIDWKRFWGSWFMVLTGLLVTIFMAACTGDPATSTPPEPEVVATAAPDISTPTAADGTTGTPTVVPTATPTPTLAPTATPTPAPTPTAMPTPTPTPAPLGVGDFLQKCEAEIGPLVATLAAAFESADVNGDADVEDITWGELAVLTDTIQTAYGGLEPPPELREYHDANLQSIRAFSEGALAHPSEDSFVEDLAALVIELVGVLFVIGFDESKTQEERDRLMEEATNEKFNELFGPEFLTVSEAVDAAKAALDKETLALVEASSCYSDSISSGEGQETDTPTPTPEAVPTPTPAPPFTGPRSREAGGPFTSVSTGSFHTCMVKPNGTVVCWGSNEDWQGSFAGQAMPPDGVFASVSAGARFTCGVRTDGSVECWGQDTQGETSPPSLSFTSVSAGALHACGVTVGGSVECWGDNEDGQSTPPEGTFASVSAGADYTCGIKADGFVECWGNDGDSYDFFNHDSPPGGEFISVSAGVFHTCGVRTNGFVECWGSDSDGEATPPQGSFTSVEVGYGYTCGVKTDGTIACWGNNAEGKATPPEGVFISVSTAVDHTCAVESGGAVVCWGGDEYGQATPLGAPIPTPTPAPTTADTDGVGSDRTALAALYNATEGVNWENNENWLSDVPFGEWYGVITDADGRVTELELSDNHLIGEIPPELGSITNLIQLNLSSNQLSGCVPNSLQDRLDMGISDLGGLPFCSDAASIAPTPIPASTSQSGNGKYDADGDGLIEISNLEQLNAVRYDLNGDGTLDWASGYSGYYDAFPIGATEAVCHNCNGFELTRSLNFKEADSYASGAVNTQWTVGSGWEPTGNSEARFLAIFDGNGHTISNVYIFRIADSHYGNAVGLFGYIGSTSLISKVGLLDVDLTGLNNVGGLVGEGSGTIRDCYTTGRVSGKEHVGGLVGRNDGTITESHSSANVSGSKEWPDEHVGGLTGFNSGTISDSYATGTVSGHYNVGGLVGSNGGRSSAIKGSYATGSVSGQDYVGGLTGISHGSIDVSYATGNVLGANDVGGLAAINYGTISRSYSTGRIEAYFNAGGLVGENSGTITASYTMSSVSSSGVNIGGEHTSGIGGLAGFNEGAIRASYAVGSVSGRGVTVGGLIGANGPSGTIIASYATGRALSSGEHEYVGGLIGSNSGEVTAGFWDTQTSGNETAVGYGESTGTGGKITSELQSPPGYTGIYSDWEEAGGFWDFGTSSQYPALEVDFDGDGAATWQEFGKQRSRAIPSPTSSQGGTLETTPEPLAASFPASPFQSARHKGDDDRPQVIVAFNRPVRSFGKDTPSVSVAGAVVSGVHRHQEGGLENAWLFFLDPAGTGEIRFALVVGRSCDGGGICTKEGNILEVAPEARTLSGPGPDE